MQDRIYISVILPLRLEWEPCYFTDVQDIAIGQRVRVSFAGKTYSGVVSAVGIEPQTAPSRIKEIAGVEAGMEPVSEKEIALWRQAADYYMCTVGEVCKAAYPAGKLSSEAAEAKLILRKKEKAAKEAQRLGKKIESLKSRIAKRKESLDKKHSKEVSERIRTEILRLEEELSRLQTDSRHPATETTATGHPATETTATTQNHQDDTSKAPTGVQSPAIKLSPAQEKAYREITDSFGKGKPVLLNGVTGSGKTEIYVSLALRTLDKGKSVLYLVPEIAVSRQLEFRLKEVFGSILLVFHSAETWLRRREVASATRSGKPYIVLGTRSSVFLPHRDLGLIIVDEEHDSSYKQESPAPRYNGRDTAIMLSGIMDGCDIILGSATPSLESIYNCRCERFTEVRLTERYFLSPDSDIEIIDTNAERRKRGMSGTFSRKLIDRIRSVLKEGGQVMILRARRSYSPVLQCPECGFIPKCPHCNVSLSYHKDRGRMKCHYCGYNVDFPTISTQDGQTYHPCPQCGSGLKGLGAGTQKVEEEARALFPDAIIARLDSDQAANRAKETEIIEQFGKGEIDILIGTQIVAKGFDFKGLMLVAVLQADTLQSAQDFRADEKALQTLRQFRGRCGRRGRKGLFVIQTARPEHPIYRNFAETGLTDSLSGTSDYTEQLFSERQNFRYPPFTRILNIIIKDDSRERAERMSAKLHDALSDALLGRKGTTMTPPFSPAVSRIADENVIMIRVSLDKDRFLSEKKKTVAGTISSFERRKRYTGHIFIDVDPA